MGDYQGRISDHRSGREAGPLELVRRDQYRGSELAASWMKLLFAGTEGANGEDGCCMVRNVGCKVDITRVVMFESDVRFEKVDTTLNILIGPSYNLI